MSRHPVFPTIAEAFAGRRKVPFPITLSAHEKRLLDRIAAERGVARAAIVRDAVECFLAEQERGRR